MSASRITCAAVAAVGLAVAVGPAARADFTAPEMLTVSPLEQADGISSSALSANGRYLVFAGSLDGVKGILRRDLQTGLTEPVAAGDAYAGTAILEAANPSISADGRYVSFTTTAALNPADDINTAADVYVRDMEAAVPAGGAPCEPSGPCAYTVASALDGTGAGLTYDGDLGAVSATRQALSADGRRVAFVVRAGSNLAGAGTPAGQVAVRDLDSRRTTLVSSTRDATTGAMTGQPVPGGAATGIAIPGEVIGGSLAALSADGSTVAWSGAHVALQVATIDGDPARMSDAYNEPLWRRIADGPSAPTRRVAGAADPEAPGCPPGGTMSDVPCQGPYPNLGANSNSSNGLQGGWLTRPTSTTPLPSLSADGRMVAFIGGPPLPPDNRPDESSDLFVADMHDGITRRAGVSRLTVDLTGNGNAVVTDLTISPNGRRIAFGTSRTVFAQSPLFVVTRPPAQAALQEVWLADLDGQTLRRLSQTIDDGPASLPGSGGPGGPVSPSFDATGRMITFDSAASNLVAADANGAPDAFLVQEHGAPAGTVGRVDISPAPAAPQIPRAWRLALRAVAQKDGSVRLDADVPGPGVLRATVTATVPVFKHVQVKRRGGGHRTVRKRVLSKRQVAVGSVVVHADGVSKLSVRVAKAYMSLAAAKTGLDAAAKVTFAAPSHATLRDTLGVRFRVVKAKATKKTTTKAKAKS